MGVAYVTAADVVNALDLPETARLTQDADAGTNQLVCDRPVGLVPGALLLVGYRGQSGETATVQTVSQDGMTITLASTLAANHPTGTLLLDATPFPNVAEAASRLVDQLTFTPAGGWAFADQVTLRMSAKVSKDGMILFPVNHTPVKQVYSVEYQTDPLDPVWSVPQSHIWWDDGSYLVQAYLGELGPLFRFNSVRVTVTYAGGYTSDEMPADIRRATAILAARLWKEKDSGYSDVIGSTDFGILQYTQAAPKDVLAMLQPRRRVGV